MNNGGVMSDANEISAVTEAQARAAAQLALPRLQQRELGARVKAAELAGDDRTAQILARIYRRVLAGARPAAAQTASPEESQA